MALLTQTSLVITSYLLISACTLCIIGQQKSNRVLSTFVSSPAEIALDRRDNVFVIESETLKIVRIDAVTKLRTTYAGNGNSKSSGDGGLATNAGINPTAIAIDDKGNVFLAEIGGRIRRIDFVTKVISTVAGNGELGYEGAGDGGPATKASFGQPASLAFDKRGNLLVSDTLDHRIRSVDFTTGLIDTVAGGGKVLLGDEGPAKEATLRFPQGIAVDSENNLFIADYQNHRIRRVDGKSGIITTVAGGDIRPASGVSDTVQMRFPRVIVLDPEENIYVAGSGNSVLKMEKNTKSLSSYAGNGAAGYSGDGKKANSAKINGPAGLAVDSLGNLLLSDRKNNRIRKVDRKTRVISTLRFRRSQRTE